MQPAEPSDLQKTGFLAGEGDAWFARNRAALDSPSRLRALTVDAIARHLVPGATTQALEIGCGQGDNLAALAERRPLAACGIDPSREAVAAGRARFGGLDLRQGTADDLPYPDARFDLVWFGFCLYLVDRALLQRVVAEADRVLRDGGLLAILDFDPDRPCMRPYHHRPPLMSFKMDHARLFLANPAYTLLEKLTWAHDGGQATGPDDRVALSLCRKNPAAAYAAEKP